MRHSSLLQFLLFASIFLLGTTQVLASETQGTISDTSKYGWGENIGWINFAPAQGQLYRGLSVTDSTITGYAWSPNFGWVNFSPTNSGQGVTNTPNGVLGGSAWIQNVGWLSMSGVTIDSRGVFRGVAGVASTTVGRVSFDCDKCTVITDWRPQSARISNDITSPPPAPASGNGPVVISQQVSQLRVLSARKSENKDKSVSSGAVTAPDVSLVTASNTSPEHFQIQAGEYQATIDVPAGASDGSLRISMEQKVAGNDAGALMDTSPSLKIIGSTFFDITAVGPNGQEVHSFKKPIKITLKLPKGLIGVDTNGLEVCWYDTLHGVWVPVPNTVFSSTAVSFFVDHLTRFAILRVLPPSATSTPTTLPVPPVHNSSVTLIFVVILCAVVVLVVFFRRHHGVQG